jgi:hypothetical protein
MRFIEVRIEREQNIVESMCVIRMDSERNSFGGAE